MRPKPSSSGDSEIEGHLVTACHRASPRRGAIHRARQAGGSAQVARWVVQGHRPPRTFPEVGSGRPGDRVRRVSRGDLSITSRYIPNREIVRIYPNGAEFCTAVKSCRASRIKSGLTLGRSRRGAACWPGASAPRPARRCASRCRNVKAARRVSS